MSGVAAVRSSSPLARGSSRCRPGLRYGPAPVRRTGDFPATGLDRGVRRMLERLGSGRESRRIGRVTASLATRIAALEGESPGARQIVFTRLRRQVALRGHTGDSRVELLAYACVAAGHALALVPRDNQRHAAAALLLGHHVEMPTGEGKTLATALAAAVVAMDGTPVHVLTANDYLAERDATRLAPLYASLALTSASVSPTMDEHGRRAAYACDVVHLTGKQAGFDWMRDALVRGPESDRPVIRLGALTAPSADAAKALLQRGLCAAIVDEADSLLLDESRTPLVLAAPVAVPRVLEQEGSVALALAGKLSRADDFTLRRDTRQVNLTETGRAALADLAGRVPGVWKAARYRDERVRQALLALHLWRRDRDYVVRDGRVVLVDEQTGRALPDRRLPHGLHGLLELKELCRMTPDDETVASIPFQSFFARYVNLVGTSGTLREARGELARTYGASLVRVRPTHPSRLTLHPPRVFASRAGQLDAMVLEVRRALERDRPVLVGTRSVDQSQGVGALLTAHGIDHRVLDASQDVDEASLVAAAGGARCVTVATNMAGRGTDIPVADDVARCGGLHLVSVAFNDARRVDRQLAGRTARQGAPGSFVQLWTLDDPALEAALPSSVLDLSRRVLAEHESSRVARAFGVRLVRLARRRIERRHAAQRRDALLARERLARHVALGGPVEHPA